MNKPTDAEKAFIAEYLLEKNSGALRESHDRLLRTAKAALLAGAGDWDAWMSLSEAVVKGEALTNRGQSK